MKKLLSFLILPLLAMIGLQAQTDVTNTYLLNPSRNQLLPTYLISDTEHTGLLSGNMILQYTGNALTQKIAHLASPFSAYNITSGNESEDVVSYGATAALRRFPPTLLITGTRDFAMSSVLATQAALTREGVDTELHVWDGMWHAFMADPEPRESVEAYGVVARFFDRRLAR